MPRTNKTKRALAAITAIPILLFIAAIFYVTSRYKINHFGDAQIDEIIFYFMNGLADGQSSSIIETVQDNILLCITVFFLLLLPVIDFYRNRISIKLDLSLLGRKKDVSFNPSLIPLKYKFIYSIIMLLISIILLLGSFGVFGYIRSLSQSSQLFEQHYVEPSSIPLTFPEKKRNLIYIYLESMENTLASSDSGGQLENSLIPELEALATDPENVSFSNQEFGMGGALPATGTTWTVGAMIAQAGGIPLKANILGGDHNSYDRFNKFFPGAYTLGDILKDNGYNQTFVMGSVASFGGRDKLLVQHGNYTIQDYNYAKQQKMIAPDYGVWWGYEDKKLFEFAKLELNRLSQLDQPFNLQMLTVDTHFTDGYLDPTCPTPHKSQYDNVYACSSKQVGNFVSWIRQQPFADNTTIIISGDHLGMQTSYYDTKISTPNYNRTVYNVFINPVVTPIRQQGRLFSSFDMYPSTLAAMGVHIPEDRLALGVNLFSEKPTLVEQYGGIAALNNELERRSNYYERKILTKTED